jgi:hypothetical protein
MYLGIAGLLLAVIGLAANQSANQSRKPHPPELNLISPNWTVSTV